jgi:transposase
MVVSLPDARQLPDEVLDALRLRALRGRELGFTEADLAGVLGVTRETVSRWWCAYAEGGIDSLPHDRTGRPLGSGRSLDDQQGAHIQQLLDDKQPDELGIASPLWSRRAVAELIAKEYGIAMPVRTVGEYLKRWGYTAKKPSRHCSNQDPEEVRKWLEDTYPAIEERAKQEKAEIHWCDETGAAADRHPAVGYARRGERATMEVPDGHIHMNLISTITNEGAIRFMTYKETMTAALFITFLARFLRSTTGKIFLILDRLPAHVAAKVDAWVSERPERLELFYLPAYSPERNPDEYLNNDLKGGLNAEGMPHNKPELRTRIQGFMRKLLHLPEHVMSYFQHPSSQYAAATQL